MFGLSVAGRSRNASNKPVASPVDGCCASGRWILRFDLRTPLNNPHTLMKLTSCPLVCAGRRCYATHLPATARTSSSCHHLRRRGCPMTSLHEPYAPILTPPAALVPFSGLSEPWTRALPAPLRFLSAALRHSRPHQTGVCAYARQ